MRAALLPAGADPFLVAYWLRHYAVVWADEVDELRVQVSGLMGNTETRDYLTEVAAGLPHVILTFSDERVDHGQVIARLLNETQADFVMLCEDDAFVRRSGVVDEMFRRVESGQTDIVASPRATATPEVTREAARRFGWQMMDSGEAGPFMWPCFLFIRRTHLLRADNFSVKQWQPGDQVMGLDYTAREENAGDTFADASMQLMGSGLRVQWVPQYRSDEHLMGGWHNAPWFHVGSLSGSTDYLLGRKEIVDRPTWLADVRGNPDWAKRLSWWQRVAGTGDGLPELRAHYLSEAADAIAQADWPTGYVKEWTRRFDPFVTWTV